MKQKTVTIIIALAVLILLVLAGRYGFTVVKIEDVEKAVQSEKFDPVAYVDGIWASKLLPAFNEKAVELPKILSEMQPDASGTASKESLIIIAKKYGLITVGEVTCLYGERQRQDYQRQHRHQPGNDGSGLGWL